MVLEEVFEGGAVGSLGSLTVFLGFIWGFLVGCNSYRPSQGTSKVLEGVQ